jgi:putative oxidoreductase
MQPRTSLWIDRGLLLARFAVGLVFVMHGGQKLFVLGYPAVTGFMASLGLPFPAVSAALLIAAELGGGLALMLGAFTRLTAAVIAFDMAVATVTVHLAHGFFLPQGYEFSLLLMLLGAAFVMTGAGAYSADAWWSRRHRGVETPAYRAAA